ncbi:DUF748 domain-containing protein [Thiomonas sp. X19]|uniref:DUF748 domain-containing protein n=1 Tax=Thiomonas sp. X19 TaxID=1050370 RepID=UPI00131495CB|nr:DUF748 domain-containing protein [Thiomonas sp. X19]
MSAARSTTLRRLLWLLLGLVLLLVLAFVTTPLTVPALLRDKAAQWIEQSTGRQASIGDIGFNPWSLRLRVDDLQLRNAANTADSLRLGSAQVRLAWSTVWTGKPQITALTLDAPQLRIVRAPSGRMDFDDILARLAKKPSRPSSGTPAFALHDARISNGSVTFDDQLAKVTTHLTGLNASLPALSTLAGSKGRMQLSASAKLNGAPLQLSASGMPFATSTPLAMTAQLQHLALAAFAPYQPATLPARLQSGDLNTRLQLSLVPAHLDSLTLSGTAQVLNGAVKTPTAPLAGWKTLKLTLAQARPLARVVEVSAVQISGLSAEFSRSAQGLVGFGQATGRKSATAVSAPPAAQGAHAASPAKRGTNNWNVHVGSVTLTDSHVRWRDATVKPAVDWSFDAPKLAVSHIAWPLTAPASFMADITGPQGMQLQLQGRGDLQQAQASLTAAHIDPQIAAAYAAPALHGMALPRGLLTTQADLQWQSKDNSAVIKMHRAHWTGFAFGPAGGLLARDIAVRDASLHWAAAPQTLTLDIGQAQIDGFAAGHNAALRAAQLSVRQAKVDLNAHSAQFGLVQVLNPQASVARDSTGQWSFKQWLPPGLLPPPGKTTVPARRGQTVQASAPWRLQVRQAEVKGGRFYLADASPKKPVVVAITGFNLGLRNVAWPQTQPTDVTLTAQISDELPADLAQGTATVAANTARRPHSATDTAVAAMPPQASAAPGKVVAASSKPGETTGMTATNAGSELIPVAGSLQFTGQVQASPFSLRGKLDARNLPAQIADNYLPPRVNAEVLRAPASASGKATLSLGPAGPAFSFDGSAGLSHFVADTLEPRERLLGWNSLQLNGLHIAHTPRAGLSPITKVVVGQVALRDFYARVILSKNAKLNLTQVFKPLPAPAAAAAAKHIATTTSSGASATKGANNLAAEGTAGRNGAEWPFGGSSSTTKSATPSAAQNLVIDVGGITLAGGRVDYTDHFVQPNYSTSLSGVEGSIGAFGTTTSKPASVELRGTAEGTAAVVLSGNANPLLSPPQLDLHGKMTDLQLAPLSPYSGRYAGYDIKRGLLSMDVHYDIDASGRLTADNQLVLNQLTFGKRVDSPTATKLPVLLAVELLKDRNGNINVNIPISGSLNNPEFSLGSVIGRAIVSLLVRAVTAPFSLLGNLIGNDVSAEQLSHVAFVPGTAILQPQDQAKLADIAKALKAKSELILTITGEVDPAAEREPYREARLNQQMLALWKRDLPHAEAYANAKTQVVPQTDYAKVLAAVYRQTPLANKPRDAIGLPKTLPEAEMQKLLLQNIPASDDRMQALAMERAVSLRTALDALGVPGARQFIAAPVLLDKPAAGWTPQASLSLTLP